MDVSRRFLPGLLVSSRQQFLESNGFRPDPLGPSLQSLTLNARGEAGINFQRGTGRDPE